MWLLASVVTIGKTGRVKERGRYVDVSMRVCVRVGVVVWLLASVVTIGKTGRVKERGRYVDVSMRVCVRLGVVVWLLDAGLRGDHR